MKHLDDEQLSLLALGEPAVTPAEADHLAFCAECAGTLAALERTVRAATVDPAAVELATPGPHNWAGIHQALGLSPGQAQDPLSRASSATASTTTAAPGSEAQVTAPGSPAGSAPGSPAGSAAGSAATASPIPLRRRAGGSRARSGARSGARSAAGRWVAMAAAAGIVVGGAAVWTAYTLLGQGPEATPSPTPTQGVVIAQAPLQPLASYTASGEALVEKLPDGTRQLVVQLSDGKISGFREVWVISPDLSKLVSLGVLDSEPGIFAIPEGLDLAKYPIVDVSNEPFDGNPAHSSDSIARGQLAAEN
jgi:hypothetical protein